MNYSDAFNSHNGKYSDKWSQYLLVYDLVLKDVKSPKTILEVGVQNGGSLEVWSELYPSAEKIIGVDINPKCSDLIFENPKITVIVGDAKADETHRNVTTHSRDFDIIVDDGSHTSEDIIKVFVKYLPMLNPNGFFIIEDLHASYWKSFGGSLFGAETAISYLKRLIDYVNRNAWSEGRSDRNLLFYRDLPISEKFLASVNNIEHLQFFDSVAIIKMRSEFKNEHPQIRVSSGSECEVAPAPEDLAGTKLVPPRGELDQKLKSGLITISEYSEMELTLKSILASRSWRWTAPLRKAASLFSRT